MRHFSVVLLPVLLSIAPAAHARDRGPVCREPTVIDEMNREIRARNYYSRIDPALVTEQPTRTANVVQCQVCVEAAPYNMTRFGDNPIRRCIEHAFLVRIVPAGFVVRDLSP
jgi:hypothetical protein